MAGAIAFEDATVSALSSAVAVAFAVSVAFAARAAHVDVGERILAALALLACLLAARERVSARRARARADRAESAVREDRAFHASLRAQLRISLNSALGFAALAVERDRDVRSDRSDHSDRDRPPGSILRSPDDDFQRAVIDATDATRALIDLADDHAALLDAVSSVSASSSDPSPRFPPLVAIAARLSRARVAPKRPHADAHQSHRRLHAQRHHRPRRRRRTRRGVERGGVVGAIDTTSPRRRVPTRRVRRRRDASRGGKSRGYR